MCKQITENFKNKLFFFHLRQLTEHSAGTLNAKCLRLSIRLSVRHTVQRPQNCVQCTLFNVPDIAILWWLSTLLCWSNTKDFFFWLDFCWIKTYGYPYISVSTDKTQLFLRSNPRMLVLFINNVQNKCLFFFSTSCKIILENPSRIQRKFSNSLLTKNYETILTSNIWDTIENTLYLA